ncbi:uncharacterized protein [Paramormyrops kingsleyae]|uniref:uncharacterized protein isoform X1 n=1 Tax=Paramormyrops kingsleyae TaxID=1676925 RepID=UPI000CD66266|nr:cleavage and polyadenylation specificity factor subunit 6-like isoform X1 [Paramormyrops kingsleyae]XP_023662768.1 cleavage and polyadenylation specificity factor subunit 6-like isoform X1 [Paramormyrops kingsleyae]
MEGDAEQAVESTDPDPPSTQGSVLASKDRGGRIKGHGREGRIGRGGRGGRGITMKRYAPSWRDRGRDNAMNGFGPERRGLGRMRPYPELRGRRARGVMGMCPHPPPPLPLPAPPMHMRGLHPPMNRPGGPLPPPRYPICRGYPPHFRGRGFPPGPPRHFCPRGFHNGPASPPHSPLGRGQRWPGPPGGRRY